MLLATCRSICVRGVPSLCSRGVGSRGLIRFQSETTFVPKPNTRVRRHRTKDEIAQENFEKQLNSDIWWVRWGAIARTERFSKGMTKYLVGAYALFLLFGGWYMKKLYAKEKELDFLQKKQLKGETNEYENLRIKELGNRLRTRDRLKLDKYNEMKMEGIEDFDGMQLENTDQNKLNESILPSRDTTEFYDHKAQEYDDDVNFEEKAIFMGARRKWLMRHCQGDVLEVACGTGRNIKYLDPSLLNSITFLDPSEKMMEITHEKFRKLFPTFKKVAFVVGKAENLVDLAQGISKGKDSKQDLDTANRNIDVVKKGSTKVQYDTIIEAFGLCSHEDPVTALKNFAFLLKPGGRIVLLEHGRGEFDFVNRILDKRAEKRLETWGCRWNLDIGEILDDSGLEIVEENRTHFGTTWCIVAKRKGDIKRKGEIGFFEKYFQSGIRRREEEEEEERAKKFKN